MMDIRDADLVVVGAGLYGLTIAERAANALGKRVCVLERRPHIGGNCFSEVDPETGIEYHKYGTHIFHTNSDDVWSYVNRFASFSDYRHRVTAMHKGQVFSMPINLGTICSFFGRYLSPTEARKHIEKQIAEEGIHRPSNLEEKAISLIGRPLYEAFIKGYTKKQWQTELTELPPGIIARLPVRFNFEPYYFSDRYQGIPLDGYGELIRKMAASENIHVRLDVDYFDVARTVAPHQLVVYSGAIDRYFNYSEGEVGWRTLDFEREVVDVDDYQGTSVMNYSDEDVPYTRIHEFKHLHPERTYDSGKSLVFREYSRSASRADDPYYPINTPRDREVYSRYEARARQEANVIFGGRLGSYKYLDMHQAVGAALQAFEKRVIPFFTVQQRSAA